MPARRSEPFRWLQSEIRTEGERGLAQLLKDWNFPDGISAPIHGPAGYLGVTSMAFERLHELAPEERAAGVRAFLERIHNVLNVLDDSSLTTIAAILAFDGRT